MRAFTAYIHRKVNANETNRAVALREKRVVVVFGSGGHTTEMLMMLQNSPIFDRYNQLIFLIGHSDSWSLQKIKSYFQTNGGYDLDQLQNQGKVRIL